MSALLYVLLTWALRGKARVLASEAKYALTERDDRVVTALPTSTRGLPPPHVPDESGIHECATAATSRLRVVIRDPGP